MTLPEISIPNRRVHQYFDILTGFCANLLFVFGLFKVLSLYSDKKYLNSVDPTVGISNQWIFIFVGTAELSLAIAYYRSCFSLANFRLSLAGLAVIFWAYRILGKLTGVTAPCACMGRFGEELNFSQSTVEISVTSVLILFTALGVYECLNKLANNKFRK
jgi:hypothetical protein